ncbi:MAG: hypothetical protein NTZ24_08500 [Deltaproteobacteria bacterium]|nr:hypothetical protein [Deltaproteobacteria bacterium]
MAKSKYSFEKRQREKARQKKQVDKAARRKEARLPKTDTDPESQIEDPGISGINADSQTSTVEENHVDREEKSPQ